MSYNAKNYTEQGGEVTHIGGKLVFEEGGSIAGFPGAANQEPVTGNQVKDVKDAFNALLIGLKNAGIMVPDSWNVSVLACPTSAAMPTSETTANSGHATVTIDGTEITITLNCKVSELAEANHGETWGKHKWLGFGVRTGLGSVVGMKFTDDTGASVTLSSADADEAATLGLNTPGDFVLYIKAEQAEYLTGEKYFTLKADGYAETTFTMKIVEPTTQEG
jgi:hypothetical protein